MSIHCDICAAVEEVPSTFPSHRYRFPMGTRWYCPSCWPDRKASYRKLVLPILLSLAVPGIILTAMYPGNLLGSELIVIAFATLFAVTALFFHELGHAVGAAACGTTVWKVIIGKGPIVWTPKWFGWEWEVHALPFSGRVIPLLTSKRWYRLKYMLIVAAGPLANVAILAVVTWPARLIYSESLQARLVWWFIFVNVLYLFFSLLPYRARIGNSRYPTDGLQLLQLPFLRPQQVEERIATGHLVTAVTLYERKKYNEARTECERAMSLAPGNHPVMVTYAATLIETGDLDNAIHLCDKVLADEPSGSRVHGTAANNKAYALMLLDPRNLQEADRLSESVYDSDRSNPIYLLTRGSVLVISGRIDEGLALLYEALDRNHRADARAWIAACIALGKARMGRAAEADRYLTEAHTLDPSCRILPFVEEEIGRLPEANSKS